MKIQGSNSGPQEVRQEDHCKPEARLGYKTGPYQKKKEKERMPNHFCSYFWKRTLNKTLKKKIVWLHFYTEVFGGESLLL